MEKITISEAYMILSYYAEGKHTDIYQPQNSAGIVLGGIYELLQSGCVRKEKNGSFPFINLFHQNIQVWKKYIQI